MSQKGRRCISSENMYAGEKGILSADAVHLGGFSSPSALLLPLMPSSHMCTNTHNYNKFAVYYMFVLFTNKQMQSVDVQIPHAHTHTHMQKTMPGWQVSPWSGLSHPMVGGQSLCGLY